jgi:pyridinium-3,5-bisthiocarboxylic acid mononucleotide nickel chelatase
MNPLPPNVLFLDATHGLAGDMFLGLLIDLGLKVSDLQAALQTLPVDDWSMQVSPVLRQQIGATHVVVSTGADQTHRHVSDILSIIEQSKLTARAKETASHTFQALAEAEARVHRIPVEQVHFHEVGAVDAIIDICGVCVGLDLLNIDRLVCGRLPGGSGTVTCAHGTLAVPVPAALELAAGRFEWELGLGEGEMVTPTGMSLLATLGAPHDGSFSMVPHRIGYGAGSRSTSVLKGILGIQRGSASIHHEQRATTHWEEVALLKVHVDDITGERVAYAMGRLMDAGALDVTATPCLMKKGRPATAIEVIASVADADRLATELLQATLSLGVRVSTTRRRVVPRQIFEVSTRYGVIRVKSSALGTRPEYEDCAAAASAHQVDLETVRQAAREAFHAQQGEQE